MQSTALDKAKTEVGVQVVQRWILARLRKRRFFSLAELNAAIAELLVWLNARRMRKIGRSRQELFEELDRPALRPLPAARCAFRWIGTSSPGNSNASDRRPRSGRREAGSAPEAHLLTDDAGSVTRRAVSMKGVDEQVI